MEDSDEMVGIMESNPNQICGACAETLDRRVGTDIFVSGNPGKRFPKNSTRFGFLSRSSKKGKTKERQDKVFRSQPTESFTALEQQKNINEVRHINTYQGDKRRWDATDTFGSSSGSSSNMGRPRANTLSSSSALSNSSSSIEAKKKSRFKQRFNNDSSTNTVGSDTSTEPRKRKVPKVFGQQGKASKRQRTE